MLKNFIKILSLFIIVFYILFSFSINAKTKDTLKLLNLFENVFERTYKNYVDEITEQELLEKALNGMLSGLDPHSGYMNEETYKEMQIDTSGKFGGLGIQITMEEGFVKIISPIDDTPAYKAGLKPGDYITQINGSPVLGLTLGEAVDLMRGKAGSKITITIAREGMDIFDVDIIRDIIKIKSVKNEVYGDIGYLRISTFSEQTSSELKKSINIINRTLNKNEIGYILDLRSNPGGLLTQAIEVSDIFLKKGEIVSTRGRNDKDIRRYKAKSGDLINEKPLVVLINGGSASASEIVAGALQDHKRAIVMGTKSFGKGSVQSIIPLQDYNRKSQGAMRLTTARYYTPSGKSIQAKGIEPDIIVEQGKFETDNNIIEFSESDLRGSLDNNKDLELENDDDNNELIKLDYQLARAINLIKALSIFDG